MQQETRSIMAFRLNHDEPVGKGLARLATRQIRKAEDELRGRRPSDRQIHEARKRVKKARAILRLTRGSGSRSLRDADQRLRRIGRALSVLRDLRAMSDTVERLRRRRPHPTVARAAAMTRERLRDRRQRLSQRAHREQLGPTTRDALRKVRRSVPRWRLDAYGLKRVLRGVRRTYRDAREAMRTARERQGAVDLHVWRKRVKALWYQLRLLEDRLQLADLAAPLNRLEEVLGEHHNISALRSCLAHDPVSDIHRHHMARLDEALLDRQRLLRDAALRLGPPIFDLKPRAFVRDLRERARLHGKRVAGSVV